MMIHVRREMWVVSVILLLLLVIHSSFQCVAAQDDFDNDGIPDLKESQLALMYSPYLHFAGGERFFPTDVNYHINNSVLYQKIDDSNMLIDSSPTVTSISLLGSGSYFLNNTLGGFEEIAEDYEQWQESPTYTVYVRVMREADYFIVQYWFFYAFNPGTLNEHQGDWEMIEVVLDLAETPLYAVYSQHFAGERASWNDVEKVDGTHPRVYVALGSHASYFRPYQGKLGLESDQVGNAFTLDPDDLQIIVLGENGIGNHPSSQGWLEYGGRWGNWAKLADISLGAAGPSGPGHAENEEKWSYPVFWGSDKFQVNQTWFTLSWITFYFIYIFAGILALLTAIKIWRIIKRRNEGKLNIVKILRSRRGIGVILGVVGILLYLIALFLPWYIVTGDVQTPTLETVGETELVLIDGVNGLRVNTLQSNQGMAQLFGIGIPFSIILLSSIILNALDLIGVEEAKSLSKTYITSGITTLIPVVVILIFITQLAGLITPFANAMAGGSAVPPQIHEMAQRISSSPMTGEYSDALDSYGNIYIAWGFGIGSYLFIASAIAKLVSGIIIRMKSSQPKETD